MIKFLCIFLAIFIILGISGIVWCRKEERKDWNQGICPNCGTSLRYFDSDSQGGDGWCCDKCHYTTWVSYHKYVYKNKKHVDYRRNFSNSKKI